jgi:HEAT repeat protein
MQVIYFITCQMYEHTWRIVLACIACLTCLLPHAAVADETADSLRLLKEYGIASDTPSVLSFLTTLQPSEKLTKQISQLVGQLADPDFKVRELASKELASIGEGVRSQLQAAAKSSDPETNWRAGKLLQQLDTQEQSQRRETLVLAALKVLKSRRDPAAAEVILATIPLLTEDTTYHVACEALWASVRPSQVQLLLPLLDSAQLRQRAAAIVALEVAAADGEAADGEAAVAKQIVEKLRPLLNDKSHLIRLAAARALLDREPVPAVTTLLELVQLSDQAVVWQADALLRLKTGQEVMTSGRQTLGEAWRAWADKHLAQTDLTRSTGAERLVLSAGRNVLEEMFSTDQASLEKGYASFLYAADNGGAAKVVDGKLRISGEGPEGDQRLYITSERMTGVDRWPDELEVRARLGGEEGNNFGWHVGVSVGQIKVIFHPGVGNGAFRAETTDEHDYIFGNEDLSFAPRTGVMHEMILRVSKTKSGAEFHVTVRDGDGAAGGKPFQRTFVVTDEQLGDYNRIGLERSGRAGAEAVFDAISIRLGK